MKGEKKERSRVENKEGGQYSREESEEGGQRLSEEKEEGGQCSSEEKEEGGQHSSEESEEGGQCSREKKEEEEEEEEKERSGVEKDRRRENEQEGSKEVSEKNKAGKDSVLPEKAHPSSRPQPKHPHPQLHRALDHHYPPHMVHSSLQNGFPSEADLARMHSHYPPPPHMYPPPPYGPRHFDPQHRNGVPPASPHHPAYASYYAHHQRMPYYPSHPYMQGELSF